MTTPKDELVRCPKIGSCYMFENVENCKTHHEPHARRGSCRGDLTRDCPACQLIAKPEPKKEVFGGTMIRGGKMNGIPLHPEPANSSKISNSCLASKPEPESPEPVLTNSGHIAECGTQTQRAMREGFNQGIDYQLTHNQVELTAIKVYWERKGYEAGKASVKIPSVGELVTVIANHSRYIEDKPTLATAIVALMKGE